MLQVKDIRKSYTTGTFTQKALDGVSITLRDNEFVAILGPSGSGKTTLLNIIGGLDHYDSGDLVIDGISTKKYKDRDWDAYRNNRIGFVFQSYNLIPHQTVLANVELALTLSGVSPEERKKRATAALERVGLGQHVNKRPSQLSGGQMQRVAIARALINDPEILLADEPTGALDSQTSVQIMDLLTEIASDRLVVMVTHNPELAEQYATRIVTIQDGQIKDDTDPYEPTAAEVERLSVKKPRYTSMSLLTALSLSFNNLMTKKARTIMTAVAGSIGIIGIAAILALANGVNEYIANVEEETLSEYPLQITSSAFNLGVSNEDENDGDGDDDSASSESAQPKQNPYFVRGSVEEEQLGVVKSVSNMFSSIGSNDLASLKAYFDGGTSGVEQYVNSIEYKYNVTPQIYSSDTSDGLNQVNPNKQLAALGLGSGSSNSLMSTAMSTDMFFQMPADENLYRDSYEVIKGRWPEKYNEMVLVVSRGGNINDFLLYTLGERDPQEMSDMVKAFMNEEEVVAPDDYQTVSYDTVLNLTYKLVNAADYYEYDSEYGVWKDKTDNDSYMKDLVDNSEDLHIVGIVRATEDARIATLNQGINYPAELTTHVVEMAAKSDIVKDQMDNPSTDVISGKEFGESDSDSEFDMSKLFSIDGSALASAFKMDTSALDIDPSSLQIDPSAIKIDPSALPQFDPNSIEVDPSTIKIDPSIMNVDFSDITEEVAKLNPIDYLKMPELGSGMAKLLGGFYDWWTNGGAIEHPDLQEAFEFYIATEEGQKLMREGAEAAIDSEKLSADLTKLMGAASDKMNAQIQQKIVPALIQAISASLSQSLQAALQAYMAQTTAALAQQIGTSMGAQMNAAMGNLMQQLTTKLSTAMSVDESAFARAFQFNIDADDLSELMKSMTTKEERTYDNNMKNFGYADLANPSEITIYPISFESKTEVINILDAYNEEMKGVDEDKVISYTDIVGLLMESVTEIVDMISMVLIAFVAISLIVSSIMIGVITYISVLERKKEIGILRAIGASKKDIGHIFNAETIIEGLISGVLGIAVTLIGCFIANMILDATGYPQVAQLPINAACILIVISVVLSFIAGVLPAGSASKKDPVEALRSE